MNPMSASHRYHWLGIAGALLTLAFVGAACSDGGGEETATSTRSPEATVPAASTPDAEGTVTGDVGDMEGFRAFAPQIEQAIVTGDAQFFLDRAVLEELTCVGDEPVGPCSGRPAGTVSGIPGGVWQGDVGGIFTPEEYEQALQRYFDGALADQSDDYGPGALALFALARGERDGEEVFYAITTSIVDAYPSTGAPVGPPGTLLREAHAFRFRFESGRWLFTGETATAAEPAAADWLSGQCADCYADWERWTGTATG